MTIEEAIKILEDILNFVKPGDPPEEHDAVKLGIEALKRLQEHRYDHIDITYRALPGETKE